MHLPSEKFSRLVTTLSLDQGNPSLDSMILAWDHIAKRHLERIAQHPVAIDKIQSIRLLAIHDAVRAILAQEAGFLYNDPSPSSSVESAVAAVARASHDVLAAVFEEPEHRADLGVLLDESLSMVTSQMEKAAGVLTGAESALRFIKVYGPLGLRHLTVESPVVPTRQPRQSLRLAQNPHWRYDWQRSA